ncbi:MAG: hypothetical protein JST30_12795 [Armatimonadetes bacterium]|nr:hypothetical protein [Armatimonadota bacterium]
MDRAELPGSANEAVTTLRSLSDAQKSDIPFLIKYAKDSSKQFQGRIVAIRTVVVLSKGDAISLLQELSTDPDQRMRVASILLLEGLSREVTDRVSESLLGDSVRGVRVVAASHLEVPVRGETRKKVLLSLAVESERGVVLFLWTSLLDPARDNMGFTSDDDLTLAEGISNFHEFRPQEFSSNLTNAFRQTQTKTPLKAPKLSAVLRRSSGAEMGLKGNLEILRFLR